MTATSVPPMASGMPSVCRKCVVPLMKAAMLLPRLSAGLPAHVALQPRFTRDEPRGAREHCHQPEHRLADHRAVADEAGVPFRRELLGRGAGRHQRVEPARRAAGDDHEDEGDDRWSSRRRQVHRRGGERRVRRDEADVHRAHADIEQQAVDVVARLQQQPHGQDARPEGVGQQQPFPLRQRRTDDRVPDADERQPQRDGESGDGQAADAPRAAVDGHAHGRGHEDQGAARQHRLRIEAGREQHRDDVDEDAHRQRDEKEDDEVEQRLAARADEVLGHLPERHPAGADGHDQRPEVVHGADEDGADDDPQHRRQPAPDDRDRGAQHRRQAGDGRVLVAEQHVAVGRDVVDLVAVADRRGRPGAGSIMNTRSARKRAYTR